MDFLSLTHGNGRAFQLQLLREGLYVVGGVGSHGEEANEWSDPVALLPGLLQVQDDPLGVLRAHALGDELASLGECAIGTPAPAQVKRNAWTTVWKEIDKKLKLVRGTYL